MDLSAVRVLDLTQLLPGPYATQLLCDMGAEILKVERPDGGDPGRHFGATDRDAEFVSSPLFDVVNRGKRSVTLDLKTESGREVFLDLAREADVVVEQFRPGVVDRLGVGYEDVRAVNEAVVYCSVTGYGQSGPDSGRAGHDLTYAGRAGLVDATRPDADAAPTVPGFPVADMAGGLFAALSIVSGLLSRELGSAETDAGAGGEYLDVALTDAVLSLSQAIAGPAMAGLDQPAGATTLTGRYPCYDVYECADGRHVTLAALEERFWETFCEAVDRPDLVELHMAPDAAVREQLREELAEIFARKPHTAWLDALETVDAMVGPVQSVSEAFEDPHLSARGVVQTVDGQLRRAAFPVETGDGPRRTEAPAPELGEHTDTVLDAAGYDAEARAKLRENGVT